MGHDHGISRPRNAFVKFSSLEEATAVVTTVNLEYNHNHNSMFRVAFRDKIIADGQLKKDSPIKGRCKIFINNVHLHDFEIQDNKFCRKSIPKGLISLAELKKLFSPFGMIYMVRINIDKNLNYVLDDLYKLPTAVVEYYYPDSVQNVLKNVLQNGPLIFHGHQLEILTQKPKKKSTI